LLLHRGDGEGDEAAVGRERGRADGDDAVPVRGRERALGILLRYGLGAAGGRRARPLPGHGGRRGGGPGGEHQSRGDERTSHGGSSRRVDGAVGWRCEDRAGGGPGQGQSGGEVRRRAEAPAGRRGTRAFWQHSDATADGGATDEIQGVLGDQGCRRTGRRAPGGRRGAGQREFEDVVGLAWAPDGALWLADAGNGRYARPGPDGGLETVRRPVPMYDLPRLGGWDEQGSFYDEAAVATDAHVRSVLPRVASPGVPVDTLILPAAKLPVPRLGQISFPL